jgi:hypothetical protein
MARLSFIFPMSCCSSDSTITIEELEHAWKAQKQQAMAARIEKQFSSAVQNTPFVQTLVALGAGLDHSFALGQFVEDQWVIHRAAEEELQKDDGLTTRPDDGLTTRPDEELQKDEELHRPDDARQTEEEGSSATAAACNT